MERGAGGIFNRSGRGGDVRHVMVWGARGSGPRRAAAYLEKPHPVGFPFEPLPSYAPELNPVEQCWNHTKYTDLANFIPDDVGHLQEAIDVSITEQGKDQNLLRSFFAYAKLPL